MAPRPWTCRKCKHKNPTKRTSICANCGKKRAPTRRPLHMAALDFPYEHYVKINGGDFCYVCGPDGDRPKNGHRFHRDHDHKTGLPRGLLCWRHNKGIDVFEDDPVALARGAAYLRRHLRKNPPPSG